MAATPGEGLEVTSRGDYIEAVLNSREKSVQVRAALSRSFLRDHNLEGDRFRQLLQGVGVTLTPDFNFKNDRHLVRATLDLQHRLQFPQVDTGKGQDGIFGDTTYKAVEAVQRAEAQAAGRRDALRVQVGLGEKLVLEEGVQPGLQEALEGVEGLRWAGKLSGNGNREVAIFIPKGIDPQKPFEMIYHFHGVNGDLVERDPESTGRNRLEQVLKAADRMSKAGRNIVMVYPLSAGHRASKKGGPLPEKRYDAAWMRPGNSTGDDMNTLHAQALSVIESQLGTRINVGLITAKGHSAGGTPLVNMAEAGFRLDRIDFLDASYGVRIPRCYPAAIRNNPNVEFNIFLKLGMPTDNASTRSAEGKKGVRIIESRKPHGLFNQIFFDWQRGNVKMEP